MHFLDLFRTLTPRERATFERYLHVFHAGQQKVLEVFRLVRAFEKEWKLSANHERIFDYVIGQLSAAGRKSVQNTFHDLKKYLLAFVSHLDAVKPPDEPEQQRIRLENLHRRGWMEAYEQQKRELLEKIPPFPEQRNWDMLQQLRVADYDYFSVNDNNKTGSHEALKEMIVQLDYFYYTTRLLYACEWLCRSSVKEKKALPFDAEQLLLDAARLPEDCLYRDIFVMLYKNDKTMAAVLRARFLKNPPENRHLERILLLYLLNFLARPSKMAITNEKKRLAMLKLYNSGLRRNLFTINGFFPIVPFSNIVNLACNLKKYNWAEGFVYRWSKKLHPDERKSMKALFRAKILFEKGEFNEVTPLLNDITYSNVVYELQAKLLEIRCYFLQKNRISLDSKLKSLTKWLKRPQGLGDDYQTPAMGFIAAMRALQRRASEAEIRACLANNPDTLLKDWILQQIETVN